MRARTRYEADLIRLDRQQSSIEQREQQLQARQQQVEQRYQQLERDSSDLEEQARQLDEWHAKLAAVSTPAPVATSRPCRKTSPASAARRAPNA